MKSLVVTTGSMSVAYLPDENHVTTPLNYDSRIFALHSRSDLGVAAAKLCFAIGSRDFGYGRLTKVTSLSRSEPV